MRWVRAGNRRGRQIKTWMTSGGHGARNHVEQVETRKMVACHAKVSAFGWISFLDLELLDRIFLCVFLELSLNSIGNINSQNIRETQTVDHYVRQLVGNLR